MRRWLPFILLALLLSIPLAWGQALSVQSGRAAYVDTEMNRIELADGDVIVPNYFTEVWLDGVPVSFDSLQPGDDVRASFDESGEVVRIDAHSVPRPPATPPGLP
jgi:hypothetical protein